jgi:uncharacterized membrane protein YeaQ/YmgE (transglycosylase-associated protein family)
MNTEPINQAPRFLMNAVIISTFVFSFRIWYGFSDDLNMFIKVLLGLVGGFMSTWVSEEVYYLSRNEGKTYRTIVCVISGCLGITISFIVLTFINKIFL